jgi:hypothetical protein
MPVTTYTKLVELRERTLTEQPQNPGGAMHAAVRNAIGANPIPINRGGPPTPSPTSGGGATPPASPPADKVDLVRLMKAGKAYGVATAGEYRFVVFYNEKRRGWSVAINRDGSWEVWGQPQTTLGKAFALVGSGL